VKTRLLPLSAAACALLCCAAPPATADAYVDRNFGLNHLQQGSAAAQPAKTASPSANTATAAPPASAPQSAAALQSAYTVNVVSATVYSKNMVYTTPLPLPSQHIVGARVTISNVVWQYGTKTQPSGFEAALCWKNTQTCLNVSKFGSGQTDYFNGKDALQSFFLQYQVAGVGSLSPPVIGDTVQLIVSYRVWPQ
jgi:flagellar protein FlhE